MSENIFSKARHWWEATGNFFAHEVWQKRLEELPPGQAFRYRSARILYCTMRGLLFEETLHIRAAALTYFTVLSLVPLLAFAFALLKGFGAYDLLVQEQLRPYVLELLAGNEPLRQAFEKLLEFVEQTGVASLGFLGLIFLLYAATRLLRNIEGALNEIWGARSARDYLEQLRDYVAIIVVTPLSLIAAVALTTLGQIIAIVRAAGETLGVSGLMDQAISLAGPLTVLFLGLLFLYIVMPNATVKVRSAAVGALIGSVLWYVVLILHVRFQVGVARFNALYSGFAAFPIFLAWQHISWLVVLVGAQIASIHQHHRSLAKRLRLAKADQAFKEAICLSAVLEVARAFVRGARPPTREQLGTLLDTPEELITELFERLVAIGILVEVNTGKDIAYALGKSPELIRVKDLLDGLRRSPGFELDSQRADGLDPLAKELWLDLDRALELSRSNCSLRELAERSVVAPAPAEESPAAPGSNSRARER